MLREVNHFLEDAERFVQSLWRTRSLRKPGRGMDYTAPEARARLRRTVERLHPSSMQLRVTKNIRETPSTRTFRFEREDGPLPPWRAGQYVSLTVDIDGLRVSRPYSISSAPGSGHLDLTVRRYDDGFVSKNLVDTVRAGDTFVSSGPRGSFYHEPLADTSDLVFLAGGAGITPFMSMLRHMEARGWPMDVVLLYGSRDPKDVIFDRELRRLARGNRRFSWHRIISEPKRGYSGLRGFIGADVIRSEVGEDLGGKTFYLCGPNAFYDFCLPELARLGVPTSRIRRELFGPPGDVTREAGWPVGLPGGETFAVTVEGGPTFQAAAGEPLLVAFERHGVAVHSTCRSGECSDCRAKLLDGRVFLPPQARVRESDRANGYIHSCVAYPITDLTVRVNRAGGAV